MSDLIMSMSGTRGIVGRVLTPEIALNTGLAYGTFWKSGTVIVGGDTRTSHDTFKSALISGLLATGMDVIDIGRVTTPTVQQMITHFGAVAGVVITASHNPAVWNGIKLMNGSGSFMDANEYAAFMSVYETQNWALKDWTGQGQLRIEHNAIEMHVDKILSLIDTRPIQNARLRVLVDANHGAGAAADPVLLDRLGVDYTILNEAPTGHFAHDPEPLEKNLSQIKSELATGKYDIGFVQDADADRLVILDGNGRFIGEDYSLAFCVDHILGVLAPSESANVVVNLSTSSILEWIAQKHHALIHYTKIGETYVTQGIKSLNAVVGGEGNGGVIFPKVGWGRDSLVGIVVALHHLAVRKKSVAEIVSEYPKYVMVRDKIQVENAAQVAETIATIRDRFKDYPQNDLDGVKVTLPNGWVHVRPSNTEPIIRIFAEGRDESSAAELAAWASPESAEKKASN
ncbi:phosphoglucosamine mutase [bacterium]|nr:phosphoglucosamine mutase [bacterium]